MKIVSTYNLYGTVSPADMKAICAQTPIERIKSLRSDERHKDAADDLDKIIQLYGEFLEVTDEPETNLLLKFDDQAKRSEMLAGSHSFADAIFRAINVIGGSSKMHRMLMV